MNNSPMDEFGHDPGIRKMRAVFARMEDAQKGLLAGAGISPFDSRLRRWREAARELFERGWARAAQRNMRLAEDEAGMLYGFALKRLLERDGISTTTLSASGVPDALARQIEELVP